MANQAKNMASDKSLPTDLHRMTAYKQLNYDPTDDSATLLADEGSSPEQYHANANILPTLSAAVASNPHINHASSHRPPMDAFSSSALYSRTPQRARDYRGGVHSQPHLSVHQKTPINQREAGHYSTNLMSASNVPHQSFPKNPLLNLSGHGVHFQSSPPSKSYLPTQGSSPVRSKSPCSHSLCIDNTGIRELLSSLALMCVLSLLMAFLALFFLQRSCPITLFNEDSQLVPAGNTSKRSPGNISQSPRSFNSKEYIRVFQISVALSTLTIALDLCCLFVCCIQFLSIIKLIKTPFTKRRQVE